MKRTVWTKGAIRLCAVGAAVAVLALTGAASRPPGAPQARAVPRKVDPPRFRLTFLKGDWIDLKLGYSWETAWPRLLRALKNAFISFDERDVVAYDWQAQRITLTPEAGGRLLAAYEAERRDRRRGLPEDLLHLEQRLRKLRALWSPNDVFWILNDRGFVVSLDGRPLYGGIVMDQDSQAAIEFPVLLASIDADRRIVLRPSPLQFSFGSLWDDGAGAALECENPAIVRELNEVFPTAKRELVEGNRELIDRLKKRILDPGVQALFAASGTHAKPPVLPAADSAPSGATVRIEVGHSLRPWFSQENPKGLARPLELWFSSSEPVAEIRYRLARYPDRSAGEAGPPEVGSWRVAIDEKKGEYEHLPLGRYRLDVEALGFAGELVGRNSEDLDLAYEVAHLNDK